MPAKRAPGPIVVKKYANRRLYDTSRSSYVTLEDLCEMVKEDREFVVQDAKTGEDLTRSVLTQIILEQEMNDDKNLLPTQFLRQLITFYDHHFQKLVPDFLEQSLNSLSQQHEKIKQQMGPAAAKIGAVFPGLKVLEDIQQKNVALFENAMRAMTPFPLRGTIPPGTKQHEHTRTAPAGTKQERIAKIRQSIAALQRELDQIQRS